MYHQYTLKHMFIARFALLGKVTLRLLKLYFIADVPAGHKAKQLMPQCINTCEFKSRRGRATNVSAKTSHTVGFQFRHIYHRIIC